jgi:hypothetical protein
MPKPVDRSETVDLHAPWWSDATDSSGRYKERWVVRKYRTERDAQAIANAMGDSIRMRQSARTNGHARKGDGGGNNSGDMELEVTANMPFARMILLLQVTVEITDENGMPLHINKELLSSFDTRETEWVADELDRLYARPEIVPVLDEDEERAALLREAVADGAEGIDPQETTAEGRAAKRFR